MNSIDTATTMTVAGADTLQYLPQPMIWPFFAATAIPTTLAEAPIGVALPPISVPIDRAQASVAVSTPWVAARLLITGSIVAAKGMLSIKALAMADSQMIMVLADAGDVVEVLRGVPLARPGNLAVPDVIGDADGGDAVLRGVVHDGFHRLHGVRGAGGEVGVDVQIVQRRMQGKSSFFRPSGAIAPAERRSTAERRG